MIIELSFQMSEYYNVSICKCKDVIVLVIHNLITYQLFQVARPARKTGGGDFPTLRTTSGACVGLCMVSHSVRCRYATESRCHMTATLTESCNH